MTLGLLLPLLLLGVAIVEIPLFLTLKQRGAMSDQAFPLMIIASASLPLIAYFALNVAFPDTGEMVIF